MPSKHVLRVSPILILASCGSDEGISGGEYDSPAVPTIEEAVEEEETKPLSDDEFLRVCRIGHGFSVGRNPDDMNASLNGKYVRLAYTRDDGKSFRYDCRVNGNVISTRMIDEAGPGTGPGAWSGRGSTSTFEIDDDSIRIREVYFDGSSDERKYPF